MGKITLKPTENQNFILLGGAFAKVLEEAHTAEANGAFAEACNIRYKAFQQIVDALPEEDAVELDFSHQNTRAAIEIIYGSAVDNFLAGDCELSAAQLELLLECDSEDHIEATPQLALCYIALEEWDCLNDILPDLGDKSAFRPLVELLAKHIRKEAIEATDIAALRRHRPLCEVLCGEAVVADEAYMRDISSERPTQKALATEIALRCEPLFDKYNDFLPLLRSLL